NSCISFRGEWPKTGGMANMNDMISSSYRPISPIWRNVMHEIQLVVCLNRISCILCMLSIVSLPRTWAMHPDRRSLRQGPGAPRGRRFCFPFPVLGYAKGRRKVERHVLATKEQAVFGHAVGETGRFDGHGRFAA